MRFDITCIVWTYVIPTVVPVARVDAVEKGPRCWVVESIVACGQAIFFFLEKLTHKINGLDCHKLIRESLDREM